MSAPGYPLETARRPPPPPLQLQRSAKRTTNPTSAHAPSEHEALLYDLPSTIPLSPPPPKGEIISPTSPSYIGHFGSGKPRSRKSSPHPTQRTHSATPSRVQTDLEAFADRCRKWYFEQDEEAGRQMTQTLATLPPAQRAPFSRLQASIRSAYHASINARRTAEFKAHVSATLPGGSLTPLSRADPSGSAAQKERYESFARFIRSWCTVGMPGTKPFFEGLWALMRLQLIPERLGGAGGRRIDWEIDDAVFKEAGGKDFMLEAVDVLKGVLGFEESPSKRTSTSTLGSPIHNTSSPAHTRSRSQPLRLKLPVPTHRNLSTQEGPLAKRPRAPSDPFLDTPALSHSYSSSPLSSAVPLSASLSDTIEDPPSPITPPQEIEDIFNPRPTATYGPQEMDEESMRTWTSPDLTNPEILQLLKVFPTFITSRATPRFPKSASPNLRPSPDLEAGQESSAAEIRIGTGKMWVSTRPRANGWEGNWWTKFKNWWHQLFC
ncbi:hypothetical protein B0F90DRAFT_1666348 [Multifurca ochricompacta]|uniref:Uncharacterized protein n=1 Tax=Multifurca ochricompacta TaxID=376703 RepID=A0AAD4M7W0_9AGAM|nr:hypothetical protein B0F90DRAFT_1666348 [Multifurca ochricompacta]